MRSFSARETEWLVKLDGIELAPFWRRAFAFTLDWFVIGILTLLLTGLGVLVLVMAREMHGIPLANASTSIFARRTFVWNLRTPS